MCQTYWVRTWPKYTVERYPKKYIVKSMQIHTNTNTIYQWWCISWSLRQLVQPLFSWISRLPMTVSVWQVWRSLGHKAGCTFRQSHRLRICWVRHRSWTWVENYSFVIVLGHGQSPILSNKPLHKLDVTSRYLCRWCTLRWWRWCTLLCATTVFTSLFRGMSWKDFANFLKIQFGFNPFLWGGQLMKKLDYQW